MSTKPGSKINSTGKLLQSTRPQPHYGREKPVAKMILYCTPEDMLAIMDAVLQTTVDDLAIVDSAGTQSGRAVAAICRQWMKGRAK